MQQIETPPAALRAHTQQRTLRLAWIILLGFFSLFVILVSSAGFGSWRFFRTATIAREATLIIPENHPTEGISWQPVNRTVYQGVRDAQTIKEGESLRIATSVGYGKAVTIRLFDESQLDLWASADLRFLNLRTSRWSDLSQEVLIRQSGGYVRYDLKDKQPYRQVQFKVLVGQATIDLAPGGSYSISFVPSNRVIHLFNGRDVPGLTTDVSVRSGTAVVHGSDGRSVIVSSDFRVEIDPAGLAGLTVPARWELIRDGNFSQFSEEEYNNTTVTDLDETGPIPALIRSNTWQVFGGPTLPISQGGFFRLSDICRPPTVSEDCSADDRRTAAWFYRAGNQTSSFTTGIEQDLGRNGEGVDISEYRSLKFSLWTRVLAQSLENVGDRGVECPVMIRFWARRDNPTNPDEERVICIYTDSANRPPRVEAEGVHYILVKSFEWTNITLELRDRDWLPDFSYLRSIQIFAQGHDYDSRVVDVSLVGAHKAEPSTGSSSK